MSLLTLHKQDTESFISPTEYQAWITKAREAHKTLTQGSGEGADFLGWLHLASETDPSLLADIEAIVTDWKKDIGFVIVVGIGGSYLGAKAVIEALSHSFAAYMPKGDYPHIVFAGNNLSEDYLSEIMDLMQGRSVACVVISKSGTTTEPAVAFRVIKQYIENTYGKKEACRRIVAVTDASRGALRTLTAKEGYRSFVIADNVGGRFSVLTPVGLLPIALAGIDIRALIKGAKDMEGETAFRNEDNPAMEYAAIRNALYAKGKKIELLVNYQPKLHYFTEWWKQLYGESEGKQHKGIFPAGVDFTTDLHSMGQYIQDGERHLFETVLSVTAADRSVVIEKDSQNLDGLNFLSGKNLDHCNKMAEAGTRLAHVDGGVPNVRIEIPKLDAYHLGALIYFFEQACGISGYILDVNPFNQEGVEAYKKNMFALLGKPGHEERRKELMSRL